MAGDGRRLASAVDLSPGGIGLELPGEPPPVGGAVTSEFSLPGISLPLALDGHVVWRDPENSRIGVAFDRVDPGLVELLESFIGGRL